jgi:pleiotropic regulator 1
MDPDSVLSRHREAAALYDFDFLSEFYLPPEVRGLLQEVKAKTEYRAVRHRVDAANKRHKISEETQKNPYFDPGRSTEHLKQVLEEHERDLQTDRLDIFTNKHLAPRLKQVHPEWHPPWKLMRVISGHQGWVRCIAVEPFNSWFATGSNDRTIKLWDLASGQLKVTLVGHINSVRGLEVSSKHSYLYSAAEDKTVKCWDLEYNKIIRSYHGHLSGVYCLKVHPSLDVLITGGRDSVCRVWDIRTKAQVHLLEGHTNAIFSIDTQEAEPQVISGSADSTVRLWDLAAGKCSGTLTHHKKSIRAVTLHPKEYTFLSAAADNLKLWKCPEGTFLRNFSGHNAIVNAMALNADDVLVTAGDDGSLCFWDYGSGYNFQKMPTRVQPGSLSCEASIFSAVFDKSSMRLITGECDKTIKIWREDETATSETHPIELSGGVFMRA